MKSIYYTHYCSFEHHFLYNVDILCENHYLWLSIILFTIAEQYTEALCWSMLRQSYLCMGMLS